MQLPCVCVCVCVTECNKYYAWDTATLQYSTPDDKTMMGGEKARHSRRQEV